MATEARVAVEGIGLRKVYGLGTPFPVEVLQGVNVRVMAGEFVAIVGQSGSGKTTLLNLLGALDRPTAGRVILDGRDTAELADDALADLRNRAVGFVFQFHYLLPEFTCLENALMPVTIRRGAASHEDVERVKALLDRVGLGDQLRKRPGQMSGGQQQRAAVIRALAAQPRLVLADEPTGNLDVRAGQGVFDMMREMTRETGVAFVMVTHDPQLADAADRIIHVELGRVHEHARLNDAQLAGP
ncbi:MAG: ABC transporter ATP-binding protein [Armatimonadetes bacterium]|nr:ABC transporter ATP-binding protein [Armatimonadota bacterium]